jgi:hypothetical protein
MVAAIIKAPESDGTSLMQRNPGAVQAELKKLGGDGDKAYVITDNGKSMATIDFIFKQGAQVPYLAIGITHEKEGMGGTKEVRYKLAEGKTLPDLVANLGTAEDTTWGVYAKGGRRRTRRTRRKSRARKSRRSRK